MTASLREALDRTLLLMRDHLVVEAHDLALLSTLTDTEVVLLGDSSNLSSHAAQCAYVTAALLMARSGHRVCLSAPDLPLVGPQPPLKGDRLVSALLEVGNDLLPGVGFSLTPPRGETGLAVVFGDSRARHRARRSVVLNASAWGARLGRKPETRCWSEQHWPLGAMAAAGLASAEAFKVAMQALRPFARSPQHFDELFAFTDQVSFDLAPEDAPRSTILGPLDFISGGAITNATLYVLARLPGVTGRARVVEPQEADLSNLNRYMLLPRSAIGRAKVEILKSQMPPRLELQGIPLLYRGGRMPELGEFGPAVLVGTDDIPVRWKVQAEKPGWLGIGATTHWAAMASFHHEGLGCAHCLHPRDEPGIAPVPTIAFVSFFPGLMLASYFLRLIGRKHIPIAEQHTYLSPLRAGHVWRSPVAVRADCPTCQSGSKLRTHRTG